MHVKRSNKFLLVENVTLYQLISILTTSLEPVGQWGSDNPIYTRTRPLRMWPSGLFLSNRQTAAFFPTWPNSYGQGLTTHQNSLKSMGVRMVSHLTKCMCLLTDPCFHSTVFLYCGPSNHWAMPLLKRVKVPGSAVQACQKSLKFVAKKLTS